MIKSAYLSWKQVDQIMKELIFCKHSLNEIIQATIEKNENFTQQYITSTLASKIKGIILQIENDLLIAKKITTIVMYDHESSMEFNRFIHLPSIINPENRQDFWQLYKNSRLKEGETMRQIKYTYVLTEKKLEIYHCFKKYAQENGLFEMRESGALLDEGPFEDLGKTFPQRDLELVLKSFRQCGGKVDQMFLSLSKLGLEGTMYANAQTFHKKIQNVVLIGLFCIYSRVCEGKQNGRMSWRKFIQKKSLTQQCEPHLQALFRIAIRQDPSEQELKDLAFLINKKYNGSQQLKKRVTDTSYKLKMMEKIKQEIKKLQREAEPVKDEHSRREERDGVSEGKSRKIVKR